MIYRLNISKEAKKTLLNLSRTDRIRITEKIMKVGENPDNRNLDVKKILGEPYFRLRVGTWRILFSRDDDIKIISIEKIKPRGDAYK